MTSQLAGQTTGETSNGPPWLVITLAAIGVIAPITVGVAPLALERIRQRNAPPARATAQPAAPGRSATVPPSPVHAPDLALEIVEEALRDAWRQRDDYRRQLDLAHVELTRYRAGSHPGGQR